MTQEQIDRYIRKPNECPYCSSTNIHASARPQWSIMDMKNTKHMGRTCYSCTKSYVEVFNLTTIKEIEDADNG